MVEYSPNCLISPSVAGLNCVGLQYNKCSFTLFIIQNTGTNGYTTKRKCMGVKWAVGRHFCHFYSSMNMYGCLYIANVSSLNQPLSGLNISYFIIRMYKKILC